MTSVNLPLLIEPDQLEQHLANPKVRVVDLCRYDIYTRQHVPHAVHLEYSQLMRNAPPVMGLLPDANHLAATLSTLGVGPDTHVVAYDEEGGGKAARFLWTLEAAGHTRHSLLNGGLNAWATEGHRLEAGVATVAPSDNDPVRQTPHPCAQQKQDDAPSGNYPVRYTDAVVADRNYILAHLQQPEVRVLDCRSPGEFTGLVKRAARAGRIPGAVNMDWALAMDQARNLRFRAEHELHVLLEERGITPDKEIVVYCHTHHRSAHTYMVLKSLGFMRVKGYPGSWSDWGNADDTPVETS